MTKTGLYGNQSMRALFKNYKKLLIVVGTMIAVVFMLNNLLTTEAVHSTEVMISAESVKEKLIQNRDQDQAIDSNNSLYGTVIVKGKSTTATMPHGMVVVYGSGHLPIARGVIKPHGTYFIGNLPTGMVVLCVTPNMHDSDDKRPGIVTHKVRKHRSGEPKIAAASIPTNLQNKIRNSEEAHQRALNTFLDQMNEDGESGPKGVFAKINQLYGGLGSPNKISKVIAPGTNNFDIELDLHAGSDGESAKADAAP